MLYDACRIRRQLAGRLAELDRRDEALAQLRRVHDVFARLGAEPELKSTRDMLRELDARPPALSHYEPTAKLTSRQVEVAVHIGRGASAKGIGKKLGIKERTVTTHLTNIYKKVGVRSGEELRVMIREGRLSLRSTGSPRSGT